MKMRLASGGREGVARGVGLSKVWQRWKDKFMGVSSQIGLFTFFILYTAGGAKVFQVLEHPNEVRSQEAGGKKLMESRQHFVATLTNLTTQDSSDKYESDVSKALSVYESAVEEAVSGGLSLVRPAVPVYKWHYVESVFFASTVITTIGYGNMAPETAMGRAFCLAYALIGIPLTLTVIGDLGSLFATALSKVYVRLRDALKWRAGRLVKLIQGSKALGERGSRGLVVLGTVGALLLYMGVGAAFFVIWEADWSFFDAFYFCFITMTTIGFGDLVPERTDVMLVCTVYILVGLALTSTIIELVRRQYAESWQQMKELSGRLGELSGPLAETLRRLGDHAGDLSVDVHLLKDLKELRHTLQLTQKLEALSRGEKGGVEEQGTEAGVGLASLLPPASPVPSPNKGKKRSSP